MDKFDKITTLSYFIRILRGRVMASQLFAVGIPKKPAKRGYSLFLSLFTHPSYLNNK